MCICDDKYFKVTNIRTPARKERTYKHAASIYKRFYMGLYKRERKITVTDLIFDCIRYKLSLIEKGEFYKVTVNSHPECEARAVLEDYDVI